jgi:hypothetical protein
MAIGYGAVKDVNTHKRCWNIEAETQSQMLVHTIADAGTRMTQMLEHECWNTGAGTRMLEHRCWNTNDTDAGTRMLEHRCWNMNAGTQMLEHE